MRTALFALALAVSTSASAALPPGSAEHRIRVGDTMRSYRLFVPKDAGNAALPLVLNLHGGGANGASQEKYSGMDDVAQREHFLVVYPDGTGRGRMLVWNAGTCCGRSPADAVDDVAFLRAVVEDVARRTPVDRRRVFATGMSNGAMMAYRLAAEAPDLVAAIAPVAGSMALARFAPLRPVPILHIHSVDDPRALYAGGLGPPFPFTKLRVLHQPVEETLRKWAANNGCAPTPHVDQRLSGSGADAGKSATRLVYAPCTSGAPVILWKLSGSGHVWPGTDRNLERILGPTTHVIDANTVIWDFFRAIGRK